MWRDAFPMLNKTMHGKPLIYLDSAATAQKPKTVIDAITSFYQEHYGTVHRAVYELATHSTSSYNKVRNQIKNFLNAKREEEIIFTKGTTEAINLVASSFGKKFLNQDDVVLITEIEHHSNLIPWQMICAERGAKLRIIPINDRGEIDLENLKNLFNNKVKILSIAHISNSLGTEHPIKEIIKLAHEYDIKVMIDAAQSAPHRPLDVQDLDCDFLAFSGHKLYGPTGIGILYGKYELLEAIPAYQGGGDMVAEATLEASSFNPPPLKFEAGTPLIAEVIGLGAAIDFIENIGFETIQKHEETLMQRLTNTLASIKSVKIIGNAKKKGGIVSFVVDGVHPLDIGTLLDFKGVAIRTGHHCSQTTMKRFGLSHTCRASLGLYNTLEEIDLFAQYLEKIILTLN